MASKRLTILADYEIENVYDLPIFTDDQRLWYFSLSSEEWQIVESLKTVNIKAYFILQLAYFKAKRIFFRFNFLNVSEDLQYVMQLYFSKQKFPKKMISKNVELRNRNHILSLLKYKAYKPNLKINLERKVAQIVAVSIEVNFVFREMLLWLENSYISVPPYSILQEIIGTGLKNEENRLNKIIMQHMTSDLEKSLRRLLKNNDALHEITNLKKRPKEFSYKEIANEVEKHQKNKELYLFTKELLPNLKISKQNIQYYASLAEYYHVDKLRRMKDEVTKLYLLCFVHQRIQEVNDNLTSCFLYYVENFKKEARDHAKEKIYEYKMENNENLPKASKLLGFYVDKTISEATFDSVKEKAFKIIEKDKIALLQRYLSGIQFDKTEYEWNYYIQIEKKFKKNLRHLFLCLNLESTENDNPLIEGIGFLKTLLLKKQSLNGEKQSSFPKRLIPKHLRKYIYENGLNNINIHKYEFLIYHQIVKQFESGKIACKDTTRFKSLKDDLVSNKQWENKDKIIKKIDMPKLRIPINDQLKELEEILETRLKEVNENIKNGQNKHIKIKTTRGKTTWSLPYKKEEDAINNPFYNQLPQVSIIDVLRFVDIKCEFMRAFTHIQPRYAKKRSDDVGITACIIANGTGLGTYKMSAISNFSWKALSLTEKMFLRLETLRKANDIVSNYISKLVVFKRWNIGKDIHASADGQKFKTKHNTLKGRYSPKYFGTCKGVVAYTMLANHVPVNTKIIGANEYEGHYMFDIVFNNSSGINADLLSMDMHGNNPINFLLLNFAGCQYAPRYTKINQKAEKLYSFKPASKYDNYLIKPTHKVKDNLIKEQWDNAQRVMVSLALKETTQSIIVKKLCSSERNDKTKEALWEYDNILRTIYILDYIDIPPLRRNVQRALNRGEAYHQLRRAVAIANGGDFRGNSDMEVEIWNECSRLVANCIILYNSYMLSLFLAQQEKKQRLENIDLIKRLSPVAWQHINFFGWYDFSSNATIVDMEKIIEQLDVEL